MSGAGIDSTPIAATAAADLSAYLYRFGKMTSTGINVCTSAGERADGVIASKPTALGQAVDLYIERVYRVEVGASGVTKGDDITTDTVGRAVTATAGQCINGKAMQTGTVGSFIQVSRPLGLALPTGFGGSELKTSGALTPGVLLSKLSVTGSQSFTLADGTATGQEINIECTVAATSPIGTLTIATPFSGEQAVYIFHAVGQSIRLVWDGTAWKLLSKKRAGSLTVVVGTDVLTNYVLTETYNLSVTGTVSSTTTKAIPAPQLVGEYIRLKCSVAASIPSGSIAVAGFTTAQVAATSFAGINATTCAGQFISNGASWDLLFVTTATYS